MVKSRQGLDTANVISRSLLLILLVFTNSAQCLLQRNRTQVDLVFPRNGTSYAPFWPFPVIFALQHNVPAWQDPRLFGKMILKWELSVIDTANAGAVEPPFQGGIWEPSMGNRLAASNPNELTIGPTAADPLPKSVLWVGIANVHKLAHGVVPKVKKDWKSVQLKMSYSWYVTNQDTCAAPKDNQRILETWTLRNSVVFTLQRNATQVPNFAELGCANTPVGAHQIINISQGRVDCPRLASPQPQPENCTFTLPAPNVDVMQKFMLDQASCNEGNRSAITKPKMGQFTTWPNANLTDTCPRMWEVGSTTKSAASGLAISFSVIIIQMLVLGLFL